MIENESLYHTPTRDRAQGRVMFHAVLAAGVCLAGSIGLWGCNGGTKTPGGGGSTSAPENSGESQISKDLLQSAVSQLDVQSLGISTSPEGAISLINQAYVGSNDDFSGDIEAAGEVWKELLTEDERAVAAGREYTPRDALHLWDALLSRDIADVAAGSGKPKLEIVNDLFALFIRNLSLAVHHPNDLPLTLQEIWMSGHATAADRAWAFASLLRQLDVDSVLLVPKEAADSQKQHFLVGALVDGKVYLYDPWLGMAIPAADGTSTATLSEVWEHPELLSKLGSDERPYPITADALKSPRVELIGDASYWAPRMQLVEKAFVGADNVRLYDSLPDTAEHPGLVNRVAKAGGESWNRDALSVWDYPESQLSARARLSVSQQDALRQFKDSWKASWQADEDAGAPSTGFSPNSHFAARLRQLSGDYQGAIRQYVQIGKMDRDFQELLKGKVVAHLFPNEPQQPGLDAGPQAEENRRLATTQRFEQFAKMSPADRNMILRGLAKYHEQNIRQYRSAADDAAFWIGICQYESGKLAAARNSFSLYLMNYPEGSWAAAARYGIALTQADEGDYAAAADTLAETPPSDPAYDGHHAQSLHWKEKASSENSAN